jgi:TPR repeat protein
MALRANSVKPEELFLLRLFGPTRFQMDHRLADSFREVAATGDKNAQFSLAMCLWGHENSETYRWLCEAGKQDHADALYCLGVMYHYRIAGRVSVPKDDAEAFRWYQRAADLGNCTAATALAECYLHGTGVRKNKNEAIKWFIVGAEGGSATAQACVGYCYSKGEGVAKDS